MVTRFMGQTANFETWYELEAPFTPLSRMYPVTREE